MSEPDNKDDGQRPVRGVFGRRAQPPQPDPAVAPSGDPSHKPAEPGREQPDDGQSPDSGSLLNISLRKEAGGGTGAEDDGSSAAGRRTGLLLDQGEFWSGSQSPNPASPRNESPRPESDEEIARRLGIRFRDDGASDGGHASPDDAEIARQLGIRFRDDDTRAITEEDPEMAATARQLGISFREESPTSRKSPNASRSHAVLLVVGFIVLVGLAGLSLLIGPLMFYFEQ